MDSSRIIHKTAVAPVPATTCLADLATPPTRHFAFHVADVSMVPNTLTWSDPMLSQDHAQSQVIEPSMLSPEKLTEMDRAYHLYIEQPSAMLTARTATRLVSLLHCSDLSEMSAQAQSAAASIAPRAPDESCMDYLRRFKKHFPALTAEDAAVAIGARTYKIRSLPEFKPPCATVEEVKQASPRQINEGAIAYARRLKRQFPVLTIKEAATASGAVAEILKRMPEFRMTAKPLQLLDKACIPIRRDGETGLVYALRIRKMLPDLSNLEVARLARTHLPLLLKHPEFSIVQTKVEIPRVVSIKQKCSNPSSG